MKTTTSTIRHSMLLLACTLFVMLFLTCSQVNAVPITITDTSGLSAEVEFTVIDATTLQVRAKNKSTAVPGGFSNSDQMLTSVSWDFGGANSIVSGSVMTGTASASINFSVSNVGASADVSGEFGFGNGGTTGLFPNYVSSNQAGTTQFSSANLDGPAVLNGPQGGLVASPVIVPLGGLGAIQDEWIATLTLSNTISNLEFLANGVTVEYGSDAAFLTIPEPSSIVCCVLAMLACLMFHRRR